MGPGRELAGESPRPSPKLGREPATPPWLPKKCGSQGDKCRQPDAEVENEPDHGGFITCDYDNFKDSEICGREGCYGPLLPHSGPSKANDEPDEKGGFLPVGFRARAHTEVRHSLDGRLGGQTRTLGGLYDIFQLKEPGVC